MCVCARVRFLSFQSTRSNTRGVLNFKRDAVTQDVSQTFGLDKVEATDASMMMMMQDAAVAAAAASAADRSNSFIQREAADAVKSSQPEAQANGSSGAPAAASTKPEAIGVSVIISHLAHTCARQCSACLRARARDRANGRSLSIPPAGCFVG